MGEMKKDCNTWEIEENSTDIIKITEIADNFKALLGGKSSPNCIPSVKLEQGSEK